MRKTPIPAEARSGMCREDLIRQRFALPPSPEGEGLDSDGGRLPPLQGNPAIH